MNNKKENLLKKGHHKFLVTGAAGFIGAALTKRLLKNGEIVIGIDNLNSYYDKNLKSSRLKEIKKTERDHSGKFFFFHESLENFAEIKKIFKKFAPEIVFNLAAQAGVRYSLEKPLDYVNSNLLGFGNILEL